MKTQAIRLGVIGVGKPWRRRYRPALASLADQFQIQAVCDLSWDRADRVSREYSADVAAAPAALFERDDLDAVLLLDSGWRKLWPLELAARRGLPTLCRLAPADVFADEAAFAAACDSSIPISVESIFRFAPAVQRLRGLLDETLGKAELILVDVARPRSKKAGHFISELQLVDGCASFFDGEAEETQAFSAGASLSEILLRWPENRAVQIRSVVTGWPARTLALRVFAQHGVATIGNPHSIRWNKGGIEYRQRFPGGSATEQLMSAFAASVREGRGMPPTLCDMARLVSIFRGGAGRGRGG
jgi:hypothetical protein